MQIGRIHVSSDWLVMKPVLIFISLAIMFAPVVQPSPFYWIGVAALIYYCYDSIHEFIHAAVIKYYGGEIKTINLRIFRPFIDFTVPSQKNTANVYAAGAIGDFCVGVLIAIVFIAGFIQSTNPGYLIITVCWVWGFIAEEFLSRDSDMRMYLRLSMD